MIQFNKQDNTWVMRITENRRIEINEDVEVTEAAQKVLDAMQHLLAQQRTWVDLTTEETRWIVETSPSIPQAVALTKDKLKEKNA